MHKVVYSNLILYICPFFVFLGFICHFILFSKNLPIFFNANCRHLFILFQCLHLCCSLHKECLNVTRPILNTLGPAMKTALATVGLTNLTSNFANMLPIMYGLFWSEIRVLYLLFYTLLIFT